MGGHLLVAVQPDPDQRHLGPTVGLQGDQMAERRRLEHRTGGFGESDHQTHGSRGRSARRGVGCRLGAGPDRWCGSLRGSAIDERTDGGTGHRRGSPTRGVKRGRDAATCRGRGRLVGQDVQGRGAGTRRGELRDPHRDGPRAAGTQRGGQDDRGARAHHPAPTGLRPGLRRRHRRAGQPGGGQEAHGSGRPVRGGGRGAHRDGEPGTGGPAQPSPPGRTAAAGHRAPRAVRPGRLRRTVAQDLLGRHAPPARPGRRPGGPAAGAVPRRTHHRTGPPQPDRPVGGHRGAGGRRHHPAADYPVPRRGRPAGQHHLCHRPRPGHRGGNRRRAQEPAGRHHGGGGLAGQPHRRPGAGRAGGGRGRGPGRRRSHRAVGDHHRFGHHLRAGPPAGERRPRRQLPAAAPAEPRRGVPVPHRPGARRRGWNAPPAAPAGAGSGRVDRGGESR